MIRQLTIKNFAIIDDLTVDFDQGMIALTGETGAGKSIIIEALSLLLGNRASADMIRYDAKKAYIEGVFYLKKEMIDKINKEIGGIEDSTLIINREIDINGRSTIRLNSRITTVSLVRSIMNKIIDLHSQHDNQYLLDKKNHLSLLDTYLKYHSTNELNEYNKSYQTYVEALNKLETAKKEELSEEQVDFYRFQLNEIENVNLKENEIEELELEKKRMSEFEKINENLRTTLAYLSSEGSALELLYEAKRALENLSDDPLYQKHFEHLNDLYYQLDDLRTELEQEASNLYFDEHRYNEIQERLFAISKLKRKYGHTYEEINEYYQDIKTKIDNFDNLTFYLDKLEQDVKNKKEEAFNKALILHVKRVEVASKLANEVMTQLQDLHLKDVQFKIEINKHDELNQHGIDDIEFFVSLNKGQPLRPLIKVASGGEISRLMLGLKVVFSKLFGIHSIIFDEIDTGVSGQVALSVGKKMKELSKHCQVICITHLPQVAAVSDYHYHVKKVNKDNTVTTDLINLNQKDRIIELAKMLSGDEISEASILNAKELLVNK